MIVIDGWWWGLMVVMMDDVGDGGTCGDGCYSDDG